jgi:ligand-binding SRPBCC domain-containing protein
MPRIEIKTIIKAEKQLVFDLARSIDLHQSSMGHTDEKAIAGRTSGLIELHETVTWKAKHFGVYQRLQVKVTEFKSPEYFVDEMMKGAFKKFKHEHIFKTVDGDFTEMKDVFDFESPFGILGRIVNFLLLEKYMTRLLIIRNQLIKKMAEGDGWKELDGLTTR